MKRINYIAAPLERLVGSRIRSALSPELRSPLAALGAALAVLGVLLGVQAARLERLQRVADTTQERVTALAGDLARARAAQSDLVRLRLTIERAVSVRRSGDVAANEIAAIGNALPEGAWLTALRRTDAGTAIDGASSSLQVVAASLELLTHLTGVSAARLASVHGVSGSDELSYSIVLDARR